MKYRVRITKAPNTENNQMAYGGQMGHSLDLGSMRYFLNQEDKDRYEVSNTIQPVPEDMANIEAERGETALIPDTDGNLIHSKIGGKRHSEGGTPLNVPEGTFIYSDTNKMKIKGQPLALFGKSVESNKGYTPASIAKQYDVNKYISIINDPNTDPIKRRTAELMLDNNKKKLAQLALVQEGKKGFPQGVPGVAQDYLSKLQESLGNPQSGLSEARYEVRYGGMIGYAQNGAEQTNAAVVNKPEWFKGNQDDWNFWTKRAGNSFGNTKDFQKVSFSDVEKNDPDYYKTYISNKPMPKAGTQYDNLFEGRTADVAKWRPKQTKINEEGIYESPEFTVVGSAKKIEDNQPEPGDAYLQKSKIKYGWTNPDKMGMLNALYNLGTVKRYTPWEPTIQMQTATPTFADPTRALAANAEQAAMAQQANSMTAGPAARYLASDIQGKAATNAANVIGQYANMNVGIANQAAANNAQIANAQMAADAERLKRLYDGNTISKQQYDNAMRQARQAVVQQYGQGVNNASTIYNMSRTESPYYAIEPGTGAMYFHSPRAAEQYLKSINNTDNSSPVIALAKRLKNAYPELSDKETLELSIDQLKLTNNPTSRRRT
jgi:hypothetical protein